MVDRVRVSDLRYQVTGACNLRCPHCFSESAKRRSDELNLDEAKRMVLDFKENGLKLLTLTGGEPLLRKRFTLELVEFLSEEGVYSRVFTNGTLMTREYARLLREAGLREAQVSIDGIGRTHDEWRGMPGSFERAVNAIKYLKDVGIRTAIRVTVMPFNYLQMPELLALAEDLSVDLLRVRPFISAGRGKDNQQYMLTKEMHDHAFGYLAEARHEAEVTMELPPPSYAFLYDRRVDPLQLKRRLRFHGCSCGRELCAVTPDGWIKPCGYFSVRIGNVRADSIRDVWRSDAFLCSLRRLERLDERCMKCEYLGICGGGCRAAAYENFGDLEAADPTCPKLRG
ncbi:Coenzyme PQQ synthesis protein E [Candidatus Methanoperedenaceae archaeon GB50]|nr:Coenzyme PQQ synthesis protein E [Candidatus Methanoperedenaceae archaeon GB50]